MSKLDQDFQCPACRAFVAELVAGVCLKCKRGFERVHRGKLEAKWSEADFKYAGKVSGVRSQVSGHESRITNHDDDEDHHEEAMSEHHHSHHENGTDTEMARELVQRFQRGAHLFKAYKGNKDLAFDCWMLALGWTDVAGGENQVAIAKLHNVTKASANKCTLMFQKRMGIEPLVGQRSREARETFSRVRKEALQNADGGTGNAEREYGRHEGTIQ